MNMERYEQFLLECDMIEQSSAFTVKQTSDLNEEYNQMSEDDIMIYGSRMLQRMDYWENRLNLEERILQQHLEKYKEFIFDEEW